MKLEGNGFYLRPVRMSDAESIVKHVQDQQIFKYIPLIPNPYTIDKARSFIRSSMRKKRLGKGYQFAVIIDGCLRGLVGLSVKENRFASIGYWLNKEYRGRGIVTEAVKLILGFCFKELKLKRVEARFLEDNNASERVMQKVGMKKEGVLRKSLFHQDRYWDETIYGVINQD